MIQKAGKDARRLGCFDSAESSLLPSQASSRLLQTQYARPQSNCAFQIAKVISASLRTKSCVATEPRASGLATSLALLLQHSPSLAFLRFQLEDLVVDFCRYDARTHFHNYCPPLSLSLCYPTNVLTGISSSILATPCRVCESHRHGKDSSLMSAQRPWCLRS